jgi:hypothetical protein
LDFPEWLDISEMIFFVFLLPIHFSNICLFLYLTILIEKNTLTAFYNIARHEDFIKHEIALRQLAIKGENSNSWFTYIQKLLQKYNLPTAYEIMGNPPTKGQWKELLL